MEILTSRIDKIWFYNNVFSEKQLSNILNFIINDNDEAEWERWIKKIVVEKVYAEFDEVNEKQVKDELKEVFNKGLHNKSQNWYNTNFKKFFQHSLTNDIKLPQKINDITSLTLVRHNAEMNDLEYQIFTDKNFNNSKEWYFVYFLNTSKEKKDKILFCDIDIVSNIDKNIMYVFKKERTKDFMIEYFGTEYLYFIKGSFTVND